MRLINKNMQDVLVSVFTVVNLNTEKEIHVLHLSCVLLVWKEKGKHTTVSL